jgi:hypothetical protein
MTKTIILSVGLLVSSLALFAQTKPSQHDTTKHATVYTCPMHPDVVSDKPGKCPKCGMTLVAKKSMKMDSTMNKKTTHKMDSTKKMTI